MRHGALLLACGAALSGCAASDFCQPDADSDVTLLVRPTDQLVQERGNPLVFSTIQAALDAASAGTQTTVCVSEGQYRERLVVPGDVHLLGAGSDRVRVVSPRSGDTVNPTDIDEVVLTLAPRQDTTAHVEGLQLADAAVCVRASGPGRSTLDAVVTERCAVGVLVDGGAASLTRSTLRSHRKWGLYAQGIDELIVDAVTVEASGTDEAPGEARLLAHLDGAGAGRVDDVAAFSGRDLRLRDNGSSAGYWVITDSSWELSDSLWSLPSQELSDDPGAGSTGGEHPALAVRGGTGRVDRLRVTTHEQGLLSLEAGYLLMLNSTWSAAQAGLTPAITLGSGGALDLLHDTLLGQGDGPTLRLTGDATLDTANSILWGHSQTLDQAGHDLDGPGLRYALVSDTSALGLELVIAADAGLAGDGLPIPQPDSPARCAGLPGIAPGGDLLGYGRPFTAGKAPDLGAYERQEACP